jgi:hypothetical protein
MPVKRFVLITAALLFTLAFTAPLPVLADLDSSGNPPPQKDNFSQWPLFGEGQLWRFQAVDGNAGGISVNGPLPFDNSTAGITTEKELYFQQVYDPDFEQEYPDQYNNIFMIGLQGYLANPQRDIVWNFDMKIDPATYGSTGFVIEPKDSFGADGVPTQLFNFFGVTYAGEENYNFGLRCTDVVEAMPVSQDPITGVDPFEWNAYEILFHFVDSQTVQASISVNDTQVCQTTRANYGETEVQVWLDNYLISFDPANPYGYTIGFNNQETPQSVFYDNIAAKAIP